MVGRDPHETGRVATTLELFFDLVFVVAFSVAGVEVAHALAEGHFFVATAGFLFSTFAAIWAWINFSWFASAFDTDDWFFRVTTMAQMVGVAVLALGIPSVFASLQGHEHIDNRVLVLGYVIMRVAMSIQWLRAAQASQRYRGACLTYAVAIWVAQIGWVAVALIDLPLWPAAIASLLLVVVELSGPVIAENSKAGPTPWHAHHIAERYGALTIVTLGEGVVGTIAALQAVVDVDGWSLDAAVLGLTGMAIPFAMWWIYFVIPTGEALHLRRRKCFVWGYGHIVVFMATAAVGAGLHVAALYIEHEAHVGPGVVVATVAVPLGLFCLGILAIYDYLLDFDPLSVLLAGGALAFLAASVVVASAGVSVVVALVIAACAPIFIVVVDELLIGTRRVAALERLRAQADPVDEALA
ncbi:low temperature requirement protein A [Gordonia sp. TBRC 11910]|uniref:Low temperature requirement protein A n=1 Tax=Gordonia asplenii TaxID=2725283 RepID=A0A848KQD0_9ACTN|nr:low temperature requirement protein A [Gordonia asplenii]NMO00896.1 low temperature requirement protein A [Gordonia asplenii]